MFKTFKYLKWTIVFFKLFFSLLNVHSSSKLERILTLMIERAKVIEIYEIYFTTHLNTFGSNILLTLKTMNFEYVALRKVIHFYVIKK